MACANNHGAVLDTLTEGVDIHWDCLINEGGHAAARSQVTQDITLQHALPFSAISTFACMGILRQKYFLCSPILGRGHPRRSGCQAVFSAMATRAASQLEATAATSRRTEMRPLISAGLMPRVMGRDSLKDGTIMKDLLYRSSLITRP